MHLNLDVDFECSIETFKSSLTWQPVGWGHPKSQVYHTGESYSGEIDEYYSSITFTYNADGIRTTKNVNGLKHEYVISGSQNEREIIYSYNGLYIA